MRASEKVGALRRSEVLSRTCRSDMQEMDMWEWGPLKWGGASVALCRAGGGWEVPLPWQLLSESRAAEGSC